jgi:hypothetical protein
MLSLSNLDVVETLRLFKSANLPVSFLVPTKTGIEKSIMDATKEVRDLLLSSGIHDFEKQQQGTDSKVLIPTKFVSKDKIIETQTSLYRPETKSGDPRIWVYKLGENTDPSDLLAIVPQKKELAVVNCSKSEMSALLNPTGNIFKDLFSTSVVGLSSTASELLSKLKLVGNKGFVNTLRPGDTGVGFTLETLLGIPANSSKAPDFKGIEIKSGRKRAHKSGRIQLFSQVPNWSISRLKGSKEILYARGKFNEKKQRTQLFHEFSAIKTNSYDMRLELENSQELLHQIYVGVEPYEKDVTWEMSLLKSRLVEKHKETFWVKAETIGKSGDENEQFQYSSVKHTSQVDPVAFPILLKTGIITLDYTIKELKPGTAKDQGYLFKISPNNLDLLFSSVNQYSLTS